MCDLNQGKFILRLCFVFIAAVVAILLCHFFLDQWIAFKMAEYRFSKTIFFKWMNELSMGVRLSAFFLIIAMGIKMAIKPLTWNEKCLFILAIAVGIAIFLKDFFKVFFGRLWPETWYMNNPSLIQHHAYGFHFWKWDYAYASFPSGHTTAVVCVMTFLWILSPRWRWLAIFGCIVQVIPLIALNYHFLGDLVAGGFLGYFVAVFAIRSSCLTSFKKEQETYLKNI
jgi:membrane-associated phospholipid phosphatase